MAIPNDKRDWRLTWLGNIACVVVFVMTVWPKPWLGHWGNVGFNAITIPLFFWIIWPDIRLLLREEER